MATMNPYLNFNGTTEEAFNFYKKVFGGEFTLLQRIRETPMAKQFPENEQDRVMHVSLPIGKGNVLMASDVLESMGQKLTPGNNYHISLATESEAETTKLFNALSAGGNVTMPLEKQFWGALFGMCIDKFGVSWMVNYDYNQKK
jgi:PhnB protein